MGRFFKKDKAELGISPFQMVLRGQTHSKTIIDVFSYDQDKVEEHEVSGTEDLKNIAKSEQKTWININGLEDIKLLKEIGEHFELSALCMSEIMDTNSRARVIEFDEYILISVKMLVPTNQQFPLGFSNGLRSENFSLIYKENTVITFQEQAGDVFDPVRDRLRNQKKRIREFGSFYLVYALLDSIIDNYLYLLSALGEKFEPLEDSILEDPDQSVVTQINQYKQELNFIRKTIKPTGDAISALIKLEMDGLDKRSKIHLKELQANITQANDVSDNFREILSDMLNIYHTIMSTKLNEIMKFLTIFSVIFIPLTFIAGIYGTNFAHVPELQLKNGYWYMWLIFIGITILMVYFLKRKNWL